MLTPLLLALSLLSADSIPSISPHRPRWPDPVSKECPSPFPVYRAVLGVGGLAAGIGLFLPTAKAIASKMGCGGDGYSCMGSGMFGVLGGMTVMVALPAIGFNIGYKLDSERESESDCVSFELIIPIDGRASQRKAASHPTSGSTALAYSFREDDPGQSNSWRTTGPQ